MSVDDAIASMREHVLTGRPCGGFLTAVLENDLIRAVAYADASSRANIWAICRHIYHELPADCWGSPAKVAAWRAARMQEREARA